MSLRQDLIRLDGLPEPSSFIDEDDQLSLVGLRTDQTRRERREGESRRQY